MNYRRQYKAAKNKLNESSSSRDESTAQVALHDFIRPLGSTTE